MSGGFESFHLFLNLYLSLFLHILEIHCCPFRRCKSVSFNCDKLGERLTSVGPRYRLALAIAQRWYLRRELVVLCVKSGARRRMWTTGTTKRAHSSHTNAH